MASELAERHQRMSAYGVIISDGSVLLAQIAPGYPGAGSWTLPGGGIDWGEAPETAFHRELYEEAGLRGTILSLLGIDSRQVQRQREGKLVGYHALRVIYEVAAAGEPSVTEVDGSVAQSSWVELGQLPQTPTAPLVEIALSMLPESRA